MCFVWIWEQTAIISLYSVNWLVCITETEWPVSSHNTSLLGTSRILTQYSHTVSSPSILTQYSHTAFSHIILIQYSHSIFSHSILTQYSHSIFSHSILTQYSQTVFSRSILIQYSHAVLSLSILRWYSLTCFLRQWLSLHMLTALKPEGYVNNIPIFSFHLTESTIHLHYEDKRVNAV